MISKIKARRKEYVTRRSNTAIKPHTIFGKLTVLEKMPSTLRSNGRPMDAVYKCACWCGAIEEMTARFLRRGKYKVCSKCRGELIGKSISEGKKNKASNK